MTLSALIPALAIVGATTVVHTQQPVPFEGERHVRVMTRNVYHGVNTQIFDVPNATSVADLLNKVAAVYTGYFASNFQERAMALAAEIEATRPDVVGVQEAVLVRTQFPADGAATPATPEAASAQTNADEIRRRVKEGQKILIVDDQGRELTGRIGELRADALMLLVGRDHSDVPYDRILRIDRPRDGVSDGALKGLGIGAGLGLLAALAAAGDDSGFLNFDFADVAPIAAPVLGGIGALIGLGLDASIRHQPNLYRRPSATRINLSPTVGRSRRGMAISVSW